MAKEQLKLVDNTNSYNFGRFSFLIPESMRLKGKQFIVGYAEVQEVSWSSKDKSNYEREKYWENEVNRIKSKNPPEGKKSALIEAADLSSNAAWKKSILYFPNYIHDDLVAYEIIEDFGALALIASIEGSHEYLGVIKSGVQNILKTYKKYSDGTQMITGPKYALESGYFQFPFDEAEKMYLRFEGHPLKIKLEIKTEVVKKIEKTNLVERLGAALATNFAPGVSVDKIRTGSRKVAGMEGDEVIMRGTENGKSELSFAWRHNGKKLSTTAPKFTIEMESKDGQLDEKLAIWDAILDSIQVLPQ